jgi:hypothetical protein
MTWNRFLYNTALWNAGREEAPAIARSIIQAHTGPHVQAVLGSSGGTVLISDFIITEGTVKKPPTQFKFPDLGAFIRAYQTQAPREDNLSIDLLAANIRGFGFKDLPACVFIVNQLPDLPASIFGLFEANLMATILGQLGQADLPAFIQAAVANLAATMLGIQAPTLPARIFVQPPSDLGARIHSPTDLAALLGPVQFADLPGNIFAFQFSDLPGNMLGIPAPTLSAFLRGIVGDVHNLPARTIPLAISPDLSALITPTIPGPDDILGIVSGTGGFDEMIGLIKSVISDIDDLGGIVKSADTEFDLIATVTGAGAFNLSGLIGAIPVGEKDRFLNAFARGVMSTALGATMTINENVAFLSALIQSLRDTADLGARIKVAETFVTALLTVSTLASRDLRATIGKPNCAGGSANYNLGANAITQHARNLGAFLESFIESNLGAAINTTDTFFAYDTIDILFSPFKLPPDPTFIATDTIPVLFSPFRGKNLGATISSIQNNVFLNATITATFPLPRVVPAITRLTALDLRFDEPQNIQEIRLQLEGALLEYIYVNGTNTSFIRDPYTDDWQINIRSFKPIAAGLFGDHAAAKICRLGGLTQFHTMDEAVRFCIQAVLGFESQANVGATIAGTGGNNNLNALVGVSSTFGDLGAVAGRVYPVDFGAITSGTGGYLGLSGFVQPVGSGIVYDLGAFIEDVREYDMVATVSGGGNAKVLTAIITVSG